MMIKNKILDFLDEVKQEALKVYWPNKKEVTTTSFMVSVIFIIASIFFLLIDSLINFFVKIIINF